MKKDTKKWATPAINRGDPWIVRRYAISIDDVLIWRRRWDSNPRALSDNSISSRARYDRFDTSPFNNYLVFGANNMISSAAQAKAI